MKIPPGLIWKSYLLFYIFFAGADLFCLILPLSPMSLYYHIAIAFNTYFFGIYVLELISLFLNALTVFPLYFYIRRITFLTRTFWCWFFVLRLAFDLMSHNYGMNLLKAVGYDNAWLAGRILLRYILLSFPSYLALYDVAFGNAFGNASGKKP